MKAAALAYSCLGWPTFPVGHDGRSPQCEHGCKDASAKAHEIEALWRGKESANVALATGTPSGVFALDIDVKHVDGRLTLATLEDEFGHLPTTWESRTPSGGAHLFFRQPDRELRNRVNFRPGLDIRTTGGSVTLPPSRRSDGRYEWVVSPRTCALAEAPEWLLDMIAPPEPQPRRVAPAFGNGPVDRYVAAAVAGEYKAVATMAPNTGRNLRLFQASANLGELVGAGVLSHGEVEDALQQAATECGLVREDGVNAVRKTIASGLRKGVQNPRRIA
jgi:hypothetical protein